MINLERIVIQDFLSIENIDYTFKQSIPIAITGINLDNNGQAKNGVGKSSFIEPIAMLTTGLTLRDCLTKELVRTGQDKAVIEGYYRNTHDNRILHIKRIIWANTKPQECYITYGTEEVHKRLDDINSKNAWILDELGITQEDFFQFFLITKEKYKPFLKASDTTKKDIVNRFSGANKTDEIFPILDAEIDSFAKLVNQYELDINKLSSQKQVYIQEIEKEENIDVEGEKEKKIKEINATIESHNDKILHSDDESLFKGQEIGNANDDLTDYKRTEENWDSLIELVKTQKEEILQEVEGVKLKVSKINEKYVRLRAFEQSKINTINNEIESIKKAINSIEQNKASIKVIIEGHEDLILRLNTEKASITNKLLESITCPKCTHEFTLDESFDVEGGKARIKTIENDIFLIQSEIVLENEKIDIENKKIAEEQNKITLQDELINSVRKIIDELRTQEVNEKKSLNDSLTVLNDKSFSFDQETQAIKNRKNDYEIGLMKKQRVISELENSLKLLQNNINTLFSEIESFERQIEIIKNESRSSIKEEYQKMCAEIDIKVSDKQKLLDTELENKKNLEQWKINFTGFKSYLANQSIKSIENYTNLYLKEMNSDLSIKIEGYKVDKKKVSEKITTTIYRSGFEFGSYGRFSGGERARIDMAVILAIQTLINLNSRNGFNCIIIDEVMESLDAVGLENIIDSLNGIDKVVMIVTQNEINVNPQNVLNFVKENGVTRIG